MNLSENYYSVFHILEAMEKDVGREIVERQAGNRRFTETDLVAFLGQTASALAFAHNKEIAHRDIKPGNIFMDLQGNYKVGDFGSFFEKKATMHTESVAGTLAYMSPQQRLIIAGQDVKYNPFKSDVFGLGFTTLSLASLALLEQPWMLEGLEQRVKAVLLELQYSQSLKDLLQAMLSVREESRPDMQTVLGVASRLSQPEESLSRPLPSEFSMKSAPLYYASVFNDTLTLYSLQSQHYTRHTLSNNFGSGGSYISLYEDTLLCIGSSPASTMVFSLSLHPSANSLTSSFIGPRSSRPR
jgi:serine/threonine protein kinase